MKVAIRWLFAFTLLTGASVAEAEFHLFRIDQIYTDASGSVQFVVLVEAGGANGEHLWLGRTLASNGAGGMQIFVFPSNLPSSNTANRKVLVATAGFAALGIVTPNYTMPDNFLPIGGGSLNYAGVHTISFGPMPTDGTSALLANGTVVPNVATNFAGQSGSVVGGPPTAVAIEYYNQTLDHYFVTHGAAEIANLDAGLTPTRWTRTTQSFRVFTAAGSGTSPVCRYRIPPDKGDSHFYGRGVQECNETGLENPTFTNEDPAYFHVILPTVGICPAGTIPLYRVYNDRADANHRYTIVRDIRDRMFTEQHWIREGDGDDYVVMCVPPEPVATTTPPPTPPPPPPPPPTPPYPGY